MRDQQAEIGPDGKPLDVANQRAHADVDVDGDLRGDLRTDMSADAATDRSLGLVKRDQRVTTTAAKIKSELDQAVLNHQMNEAALRDVDRDIEKAKAAGDEDKLTRLEVQKENLAAPQKGLEKTISTAHADLALIDNPGTSQAAMNQMLARRNAAGTTGAKSETTTDNADYQQAIGRGGVKVPLTGDKRPERRFSASANESTTTETTSTVNNAAVTQTTTNGTSLDHHGLKSTSSSSTRVDAGKDSASSSQSTQDHFGLTQDAGLGVTSTTEKGDSETNGDVTSSSAQKNTLQIGTGGVAKTKETTNTVDDYQHKDTQTTSLTHGDGKLGMASSSSSSVGNIDKDTGALKDGNTNTRSGEAHVGADKDGLTLGGSGSVGRQNVHELKPEETKKKDEKIENPAAKEIKTGVTATGDGHVTISVKKYEGEDEAMKDRFVIVVNVHLGASIGGSADAGAKWKEQDGSKGQAGSVGGGVDGSAKGAADLTFQHMMSPEECKEYLAQLGAVNAANAGNGKYPELAQISAAWRDGWRGGAGAAVNAVRAAALDNPDAVRKMADGDKIEFSVSGSVEGKAHVDASAGIIDVGAHGGVGKGGTIKFTLAKVHDELLVTGAIDVDTEQSKGGSLGVFGVKATGDHTEKKTDGTSVTFHLNPDEMSIKTEILEARTRSDLEALSKKYPKLLKEHEVSTAETADNSLALELWKAKLQLGDTGLQSQTIKTDGDGKQTQTDIGSNKHGATFGIGDYKISGNETDRIETTVGPDGKALGDISHDTAGSDPGKSYDNYEDRKNQSATHSAAFKVEESTDQSGMLLSDADYNAIIGAAADPPSWNSHAVSNRNRDDWRKLGHDINAAHGDKKRVGELLKGFLAASDHDRDELVEAVVRKPLGSGEGGSLYDFPEGLGNLKPQYKALVFADPSAKAATLAAAGKEVEAATEAKAKIGALDMLYNQISSAQLKFQETGKIAAYGEMLHNITERKNELSKYIKASDHDKAVARYNDLLTDCYKFQEQENAAYAKIVDRDGHDVAETTKAENELRGLYLKWDPEYAELSELGRAWGFHKEVWSKLKPDKYRLEQSLKGEKPVGKSLDEKFDEQLADQTEEQREAKMTANLRRPTGIAAAKAEQAKNATERDAAAHTQTEAVAQAKHKAAAAAQWHNSATKAHKTIAPAAQQKARAGWSKWAAATEQESHFKYVAGSPDAVAAAVDISAQKTIDLFHEAETLFEAGQALDHED